MRDGAPPDRFPRGDEVSERVVLIGAGSVQFGPGTIGDLLQSSALEGSTIVLHDIDATALGAVEKKATAYVEQKALRYTIEATTDRPAALKGATFVIIAIEVGDRFALWEQDWMVPLQNGIRQVYGENGGPGGLFHALRITPPILEICADIQAHCPAAHIFNYSNPMSRICTTVARKFPDLRFVGLCHEIANMFRQLPPMLGVPLSNLELQAGGLNHFSFLLEVRYRDSGKDAYPDVRERAAGFYADLSASLGEAAAKSGRHPGELPPVLRKREPGFVERGLFMELLDKFGYLPITSDSHFGEYIQWAHEVADHRGIRDFYYWYKTISSNRATAQIHSDGYRERVVPIIEGILADSGVEEAAVNVPNAGPLIADLPEFIVVEVPARLRREGPVGVALGALPRGVAGLLSNQVAIHDLTAEAVLTGSRAAALQALLVDPVVDSVRAAEASLATILDLQAPYLGYLR